jgi:hypothetical protein
MARSHADPALRDRPHHLDEWHAQPTITEYKGVPFVEMADIDSMARFSVPYVNVYGAEGMGCARPHSTAVAVRWLRRI